VNGHARYALYFVPPATSALYELGSSLLGYDSYSGSDVAYPKDAALPDDWTALTEAPRRYGFHATLKAPFRLTADCDEARLIDAVTEFCSEPREIPAIRPAVRTLGTFIAIVPRERSGALDRLAADCVRSFDRFRAPPSAADRARRAVSTLGERERANLARWGYPYVFEDFLFHMTLTGPLGDERRAGIGNLLSAFVSRRHGSDTITIDRIALVRQDHEAARFRVLCEAPLRNMQPARAHS
jgi:putative phosphonate metabolism protein